MSKLEAGREKKKPAGKWVKWTPKTMAQFARQFVTVGIPVITGVTIIESDRIGAKAKR